MSVEVNRRMYICCQNNQKPFYKAQAKAVYGEKWLIIDRMDEADRVLVVGEAGTGQMEEEILEAKRLGISLHYVTEKFAAEEFEDALLSNRKQIEVRRTEKVKTHERER